MCACVCSSVPLVALLLYCMFSNSLVLESGDGTLPVREVDVQAMVNAGVLVTDTSDFGDELYSVNDSAYAFRAAYRIKDGSRNIFQTSQPASKQSKLQLICNLVLNNWVPLDTLPRLSFYSTDSEKQFVCDLSKPRLYFECLTRAPEILRSVIEDEDHLSCIYHLFPNGYYKCLLSGSGAHDVSVNPCVLLQGSQSRGRLCNHVM